MINNRDCGIVSSTTVQCQLQLVDFTCEEMMQNQSSKNCYDCWLQTMFRSKQCRQFSYHFLTSPQQQQIQILKDNDEDCFDIKISYRYNCILVIVGSKIQIFDRESKKLIHSFEYDEEYFLQLLDDDHDELYLLCQRGSLEKFRLGSFINRNTNETASLTTWKIELTDVPNAIDLFYENSMRFLVMVNERGLEFRDCETGQIVTNIQIFGTIIFAFGMISNSYAQQQLVFVHKKLIEIHEIIPTTIDENENYQFSLKLLSSSPINGGESIHTIIYDSTMKFLVLSNMDSSRVMVFQKEDLKLVKEYGENDSKIFPSGICLDKCSGELLVAYSNGIISIFK